MPPVQITMIVPVSLVATVRAMAQTVAGVAAAGMWTTGLSPTGALPPTHYVSSGQIDEQFADLLTSPEALTAAAGVALPLARDVLTACVVNSDDPHAVLSTAGLQLAQEPLT